MISMARTSALLFALPLMLFALGMGNSTHAQIDFGDGSLNLANQGDSQSEPKLTVKFDKKSVKKGDTMTASISLEIDKKSYVYSQNSGAGTATKINLSQIQGLQQLDKNFQPDRKPKEEVEPLFGDAKVEKYYGGVTWTARFKVTGEASPSITGEIRYMVCDDNSCNQFPEPLKLQAKLEKGTASPSGAMLVTEQAEDEESKSDSTAEGVETLEPLRGEVLDQTTIKPEREFGGPDPIAFDIRVLNTSGSEEAEKTIVLAITAKVDKPWHIFAQNQDPEMVGLPTVIDVEDVAGLSPLDSDFLPSEAPEIFKPEGIPGPDGKEVVQHMFHGSITWQRRFQLDSSEFSGPLKASLRYQLCEEDGQCLPPNTIEISLMDEGTVSAETPLEVSNDGNGDEAGEEELAQSSRSESLQDKGLVPFLLTGIIFGYMALLTPCVFPMIPITVSFFLKQAESKHHKPVGMALLYCIGIVATFTLIGIIVSAFFGAAGMNQLANNPWFNFFLAAVLIFFGLSMLGLFEIRVPSWLLTWSSSKEGQGGVIGVLFMAFTFTLVSFTCTFAFVGLLLPMAAQGNYYWPALGMIAFSAAFASPFFFLALFPSYLKRLPKSGGWMNNVKVIFGLLEIGAAFKFLSVADIVIFSAPFIFDYSLVMTSWMVLSIVAGVYLLGLFRMPHDTASDSIGALRLSFAIAFLGFAAYLSSGIYGAQKPKGALWEQIAAFAPPSYESIDDVELGPALEHDDLLYALDVEQAVQYAKAKNQPLFYDFTGTNCVNCRFMEVNVFPKEQNQKLLEEFVRVQLYTDTIPEMNGERAQKLLKKNRSLQQDWFNDATMPAYAIVTPDGDTILSSYKGKERAEGQFTRFLESGLNEWRRMASAPRTTVQR